MAELWQRWEAGGELHHQHNVDNGIPGGANAAGLRGDEGGDSGVHEGASAAAGEAGDPRERRGAGAHLDAVHPGVISGGADRGRQVGDGDGAHGPGGPALRGRHRLRLPRLPRRLLLHRPSAPPERWRRRQRLTPLAPQSTHFLHFSR